VACLALPSHTFISAHGRIAAPIDVCGRRRKLTLLRRFHIPQFHPWRAIYPPLCLCGEDGIDLRIDQVEVDHGRDAAGREEGEEAVHHHQAPGAVEHRGARALPRRAVHVSLELWGPDVVH
jgi:hypothetical protein